MPKGKRKGAGKGNGANLGFEEKLWQAADKMRGHMDPGEYKHVALGLIFLKYISDPVVFLEAIPETGVGKFDKKAQREQFKSWPPKE